MSRQREIPHDFEGEQLESVFVGRRDGQARPTVILVPTVMGVSELELGFARQLVELGYNSLVADLFGKKFRGAERDVMFGEMGRLKGDRAALRRRLVHVLELVREIDEVEDGRSSSPAIASAACARSIWPEAAPTSPPQSPSTGCSIRRGWSPRRSAPRWWRSMAGTTRWCRPKRSSRSARS